MKAYSNCIVILHILNSWARLHTNPFSWAHYMISKNNCYGKIYELVFGAEPQSKSAKNSDCKWTEYRSRSVIANAIPKHKYLTILQWYFNEISGLPSCSAIVKIYLNNIKKKRMKLLGRIE